MYTRDNLKYKYDYNNYYNTATMPVRPKVNKPSPSMPKPKRKRKKASLLANLTLATVLLGFSAIILSTGFDLVKKFYLTVPINNIGSEYHFMSYLSKENGGINLSEYIFPTKQYLSNYTFLNEKIEYPAPNKYAKMKPLFYGDRLVNLEFSLLNLNKKYANIKPAVFAWSMDNGNYIEINADKIYPSASIIKIPVLIQMYKSIEAEQFGLKDSMFLTEYYRSEGSGNMQYSQAGRKYSLYELASLMIQDSDNTATNMLMSKVGSMNDVNAAMRSWGIENTHLQTWLPDITGNNYTTARDIAKMLYNIGRDDNKFLNINSQSDIINIMSKVKNVSLIKAGLPDGVSFIHKTGDIGTMLGDAGIVYLPNGQRYIVVIMAMRPHNNINGRLYIQEASKMIYDYFSTRN
ncbi:serine hydrolase [bacterium]|nr:serine hydrolase [bacterium]